MSITDTRPSLDSELLRTFLVVAREGSVSRGAERILRTQSAVSLQIQKLEDAVGRRLFERHSRGVSLTASGEVLLATARSVIATLDRAAEDLRGLELGGELRIGVPDEYGESILATILSRFADAHPTASVIVHCASSGGFAEALANGRLDMALHSPERLGPGEKVILRERAIWVGSAFKDTHNRRPLPVALFDKACWWRDRSLELLDGSGLPYRIVCTSGSVAGIRAAVSSGMAVGVLPQTALTADLRILRGEVLPHLGDSPVVLSVSDHAPKGLADAMAETIVEAFGSIS